MEGRVESIAREVRIDLLRMFYKSGTGHMAPALSCVDIFTELYFEPVINWDMRFSDERDRVILSKGHGCAAFYAVLARAGYFDREELLTFYQNDSRLGGHPNISLPGIESATGSLGHGICFATGTAMAARIDNAAYRTYVVMGDGEMQEGSVWEAAMFSGNQALANLTAIVDRNNLQGSDMVDDIAPIDPLEEKWRSFKWNVIRVNGHDFEELKAAFDGAKSCTEKPTVIIAETVKGKGVDISENRKEWHSRAPKGEEWDQICAEYGIGRKELERI